MKWIEQDTKIKGYGRDIIFAKEKYYIAHFMPNGIANSDDLLHWNNVLLSDPRIGDVAHLAYGNSTFILTGEAGNTRETYIYISKDGENWNLKKIDTGSNISLPSNTCRFLNGKFIFVTGYYRANSETGERNYTMTQIYETKNGDTIKRHDFKFNGNKKIDIMDIAYGNGLYILVGATGSIFTSINLNDWQEQVSNVTDKLVGISFGKGKFIITGANGIILTSVDGVNWTKQNSNTTSYLIRTQYGNGLYVATGYNGTILTSVNGIDWIEEADPFLRTVIYGLVFVNNKYVVTAGRYGATETIPIAYSEVSRELSISNDDSLYIFNKNLELEGVIDDFISLRWRRKYYEAGEFELVVAPYENNLKLLTKKDNIIIRKNYTEAAIIDTVEFDDDGNQIELKVSGMFLSYLLKRRIVKSKINYSGNLIDGMKTLLSQMTPLTKEFEIEPTALDSQDISFQCTYKNVYEQEVELSKAGNIGFRIVPNIENRVYRFENYIGLDRTRNQTVNERYCFSYIHENIEKANVIDTLVNKCNYVLVGGKGEDENRILTEVKEDGVSGFELFESFYDAKSESNENLTNQEYLEVLNTKGRNQLNFGTVTMKATAKNSIDYKTKWDLGDIVDIWIDEWNLTESQRIVEIEETVENGTKSIYPVFGEVLSESIF